MAKTYFTIISNSKFIINSIYTLVHVNGRLSTMKILLLINLNRAMKKSPKHETENVQTYKVLFTHKFFYITRLSD